jgi:predicted Zn finger-like uncharacterized protein
MIIECKKCLKRFSVKDSDIPSKGRTVQCGNCSAQWLQMPMQSAVTTENLDIEKKSSKITPSIATDNLETEDDTSQDLSKNEFTASDGKNYKFLGSQWSEILPSGKFGRLARKNISKELNKLAGRKKVIKKIVQKSTQSLDQYQEKQNKGMGIFGYLMVSVISVAALILLLDTFKHQLISVFPNLDNYLIYIFETLNNIYIIIKDIFNNYK